MMTAHPAGRQPSPLARSGHEHILLLAFYFAPENTSGVQRATRFAKYLPQSGIPTHVICSSHKGSLATPNVDYVPNPTGPRAVSLNTERLAAFLQRIAPYNEQIPWVPHAVAAAEEFISKAQVSAILSTSPPHGTHLAALILKRRYKHLKWIADFRDPILGNPGRPRAWAIPYDRLLEYFLFTAADHLIAVTDVVVSDWRERYPGMKSKMSLIWNGFDPEEAFGPLPLPDRSYKVIRHVGVLYEQRHPMRLFSALDQLIQSGKVDPSRVRLHFRGHISGKDKLLTHESAQRLLRLGCLVIDDAIIPREEAMRETATADILLLLDVVDLSSKGYTIPAKLYEYILVGRPIFAVTTPGSPTHRILESSAVRYEQASNTDHQEVFEKKLLSILTADTRPTRPSDSFLEQFDGKQQAKQLVSILSTLRG